MAIPITCDQLFPTLLDNYRDSLSVRDLCQFPVLPPVGSGLGCHAMTDDRWFSVDEIAAHLGVKRDTIYKWIDRKNMPAHKVGRLWKFRKDE